MRISRKDNARLKIILSVEEEQKTGCLNWLGGRQSNGYGRVNFLGTSCYIHRVVYSLWVGRIPKGFDVCHTCDNRICCNPQHLFVGTRKDNMADCVRKGRHVRGDRHSKLLRGDKGPNAKLSWRSVNSIRALYGKGIKTKNLADRFGVSVDTIRRIVRGDTWKENV